jgi:hypothetical protein
MKQKRTLWMGFFRGGKPNWKSLGRDMDEAIDCHALGDGTGRHGWLWKKLRARGHSVRRVRLNLTVL